MWIELTTISFRRLIEQWDGEHKDGEKFEISVKFLTSRNYVFIFSSLNSRRSNSGLSENIFHAQLNSLRTKIKVGCRHPIEHAAPGITQGKLRSRSQKTFDLKSIYCEEVKSRIKFCLNISFSVFRHFSILKPSIIDFSLFFYACECPRRRRLDGWHRRRCRRLGFVIFFARTLCVSYFLFSEKLSLQKTE